ncbi:hypothetical protein ES703_69107 [subsurface metagenome]
MPLSETGGGIARWLEDFRNCYLFQRKVFLPFRLLEFLVWIITARNKIGQVQTGRIPSGHNAGPRWRADRACGVCIGKSHPLVGKPVDIGSFIVIAAVAAQLRPAHIIGEDKKKVRLFFVIARLALRAVAISDSRTIEIASLRSQ